MNGNGSQIEDLPCGVQRDTQEILQTAGVVSMYKASTRRNMKTAPGNRIRLLLALILILQVASVTPVFAEPSSLPESPMVTVEIPKGEEELFNLFQAVKEVISELHSSEVDSHTLYRGAIKGLFDSLNDPYSQYLDKEQFASLSSSLEGEFSGIGVTIDLIDGNITVVNTFKNSPAERAGIRAGDIIVGADSTDLRGKVPYDASVLLRGKEGTNVTVIVNRPSTGEILTFTITRAVIRIPSMDFKDLGNGIFYIEISQFTSSTGKSFAAIVNHVREQGAKGLILDLRNNPGGLLDSSVEVAGELVPKGPVVELRRKDLSEILESDKETEPMPTVVLTNKGTASAAEIVAGAVRDRGIGILIGEPTFGKACVQTVIPLGDDLGGFKLTIADYYTPAGNLISGTGLTPDIPVKAEAIQLPQEIVYKRPMKRGLVGLDVLGLQEALKFMGYDAGEPDGVFGPKTDRAVASFCLDHKLVYKGTVTKAEVSRLNLAVLEYAANRPDIVLDRALVAMEKWLETGAW